MKKIVLTLALLFVLSVSAFSQGVDSRFVSGITRGAYPHLGEMTATDSIHYVGRFFLRDKDRLAFDSLSLYVLNTDSLRFGVLVKPQGQDTVRVITNDGTGGDPIHYVQKTAAGATPIPWYVIENAIGDDAAAMPYFDLYLMVYKVGTETPGSTLSGDTFTVIPRAYK